MPKKTAAKARTTRTKPTTRIASKPACPKGHPLREEAGMLVCSTCSPRYMAHKRA